MSQQLDGLFEELEDETPPSPKTLGQEIGEAISGALKGLGDTQDKRTAKAIEAMADTISKAMPKPVPTVEAKPITEWDFDIERDDDGLMTRVVAKANQ